MWSARNACQRQWNLHTCPEIKPLHARIHSLRMKDGKRIKILQISAFRNFTDGGRGNSNWKILHVRKYRAGGHLVMCGEFTLFLPYIWYWHSECTGLFISPSWISELDCATTKTDTAERSVATRVAGTGLTSAASPRVHISSTCKVGQKLGEILYLLICFFLPCLSWLLRSRVRKSGRNLWITLCFIHKTFQEFSFLPSSECWL